jgi:hypothetical protein
MFALYLDGLNNTYDQCTELTTSSMIFDGDTITMVSTACPYIPASDPADCYRLDLCRRDVPDAPIDDDHYIYGAHGK